MSKYLLFIILFTPSVSFASVQISEIAWMGSYDSPNHEWIELHNTGSSVSVDGWILHDANNLTIELAGTINASSRVVLERTSDASAPGSAFLIYTGALSNSGATLVLRDSSGDVVDQVNGGDSWEIIGGNNETKHTPQRQSGQWVTAVATPSSAPPSIVDGTDDDSDSESEPDQTTTDVSTVGTGGNTETLQLVLPDITLQLVISALTRVHVGQSFSLTVEPSGVGKTIADSLTYEWNLGNGEKRSGKDIDYRFVYPGQYVIVVSGEYKRQKQFARQTIVVLPVELALAQSDDGQSYVLHNNSTHEIDVGGYRLVGNDEHVFPKHTIILPQSQVSLPVKVTDHRQAVAALYDETGSAITLHIPGFIPLVDSQPLVSEPVMRVVSMSPPIQPVVTPPANFGFASDKNVPTLPVTVESEPQPQSLTPQVAAAAGVPNNPLQENWPTFAMISLLILGSIGIYVVPHKKDDPPWV
jgi:hypothetical protein